MKKLLLFFFITKVFSAKIAFLCQDPSPFDTTFYFYNEIIEELHRLGHKTKFEIVNKLKKPNLSSYDLLLATFNYDLPKAFKKKTILYLLEPPVVVKDFEHPEVLDQYKAVFTWNHFICDNKKYFKAFFPCLNTFYDEFVPFNERSFACLISSELSEIYPHKKELYSKRASIAEIYDIYYPHDLSLYGRRGWEKYDFRIYKGSCKDKDETQKHHKFCYCFENWDNDVHYISEKILDCIKCRCVPIYLGSSNIGTYIPKDCFIDARNFKSIHDLHKTLKNMSEETWLHYTNAMKKFFFSSQSKVFKKERHVQSVIDVIEKCIGDLK